MIQDSIYNEEVRRRVNAERLLREAEAKVERLAAVEDVLREVSLNGVINLAKLDEAEALVEQHEQTIAALTAVLDVERNYWQTRSHLARTKTEEVMAEYHLVLIAAALAVPEGDTDE